MKVFVNEVNQLAQDNYRTYEFEDVFDLEMLIGVSADCIIEEFHTYDREKNRYWFTLKNTYTKKLLGYYYTQGDR